MANTILTQEEIEQTSTDNSGQFLQVDNYLSEFQTPEQKAVARENLNVYNRDAVYTRQESDIKLDETIKAAFEKYLNEEDPHGILPIVEQMIIDFVKNDGSTPFIAPQKGVDPVSELDLVTKRFVTKVIKDHLSSDDPHNIIDQVRDILEQYVKQTDVYFKSQVYTKDEVDKQAANYIKKDGTTPFTKAQRGADPQIDSDLATKRYVDKVNYQHLVDIDPHGFVALLNNRLASYAKANNVYDKAQTYSRVQIDSIIRSLVLDAAKEVIIDHLNAHDPHNIISEIKREKYIKQDGSIPFRSPQQGVDAVNDSDLTTLQQVKEIKTELLDAINNKECEWKTSGPVLTNVGMVEKGNEFADTITLQEVMDAIFYGKGISITASELVKVGDTATIEVCVQGSLASLEYGELYQNGQLIHSFTRGEFEESNCITVSSLPIEEDTEFVFKAFYINGSVHEVSTFTKLAMPIFVGIIPKWKSGNTITYDYLMQLYFEDGVNNKFYDNSNKLARIDHKFEFSGRNLKQILLALPADYPDLYQMVIPSQQFGIEAFDVIDMIPFQIPGTDKDIVYKLYIYKQAIVQLNNPTTFNFVTDHE